MLDDDDDDDDGDDDAGIILRRVFTGLCYVLYASSSMCVAAATSVRF